MSADNWLYLTKTKKGYRLTEYVGDGHKTWHEDFKELGEAMLRAKDMMEVEDIEHGLRLGVI